MSLTVHVPTPDTPEKVRKAAEAPGRPWVRLAGGWIADLAGAKKFIVLCEFCVSKFHPAQHHYELWRRPDEIQVRSKCDGCNQFSPRCTGFIHQSTHDQVGVWQRTRRRGRWAS